MSENFINIEISDAEADDKLFIQQSLTADTANIIGTSYKGKAFVPHKLYFANRVNGQEVYNTRQNMIGTARQNQIGHLYDEYSCFANSLAYDAADLWLSNGGEHASFTRVLGIGTGTRDITTNKMINSGFNSSQNISSGTLSHTVSRNINAVDGGPDGHTAFVLKTLNEESKRTNVNNENVDVNTVDYVSEIGYYKSGNDHLYNVTSSTNFISDVILFPSGVIPNLAKNIENIDDRPFGYYTSASSYNTQKKDEISTSNCLINLNGFSPYNLSDEYSKPWSFIRISSNNNSNDIVKQTQYSMLDKNFFSNRFLERGHLAYATFSFAGINIDSNKNHNYNILCTKKYNEVISGLPEADQQVPDYNSFESEFTTAKTPWITSQPLDRTDISDNRLDLHNRVVNLFRFWALDDGEIGNRFRFKINITKRGTQDAIKSDKVNYSEFDLYIFEYEPRDNSYKLEETFKNLNLNPSSKNYIARKIGTENQFYDFSSDIIVQRGKFKNKSLLVRVEVDSKIDENSYYSQHEILPSGFRSYPHLSLKKNAFKNWKGSDDSLNTLFDTQKVYQMPPMYALNYYEDYVLGRAESIENHWGVVFTQPTVKNNVFKPRFDSSSTNNEQELKRSISPHFYYTKYFLSGCKDSSKNIWIEEDNYLNSFFHLEKIITKENGTYNKANPRDMIYKHSGRPLPDNSSYVYLNLNSDNIWEYSSRLKVKYINKLSFDFFAYGGFDGVDIRDNDKKLLRNDALIRELRDTNEKQTTFTAYNKAIDIAMNDANCEGNIIVTPGIKELPIVRKIVQKCEEDKKYFYIADIGGAAFDNKITYTNTSNEELITSYGSMGQHYLLENNLSNYVLDSYGLTSNDKRFKLDEEKYFSYKDLLEKQFDYTIQNWNNSTISSRYLMPVFGEIAMNSIDDLPIVKKQITSDSFVLAKFASQTNLRSSITTTEAVPQSNQINNILSYSVINSLHNSENYIDFNKNTSILKKSGVNLVYKPLTNNNVNVISENTAYENRRSILQRQSIIRTIQDIKKRIKYNVFINDDLIEGGFLFSQNSNFQNLYTKLEIQLDTLLQSFVNAGLIENYKISIPRKEDDKTILDMQNYIIRGKIVLQFGQSDIIDLQLDELLNDLSLLDGDKQDTVQVPTF